MNETIGTNKNPRSLDIFGLLFFGGLIGFALGERFASWQDVIVGGQVFAGVVEYGHSAPIASYLAHAWTVWHQFTAFLMHIGFSEISISYIFSGIIGMLFYQGLALISFGISGDVRFVDSETGTTLDVSSAADLVAMYEEYRLSYERNLALLCQQRAGRFLAIDSEASLDWVLFDLFRRKGWIA